MTYYRTHLRRPSYVPAPRATVENGDQRFSSLLEKKLSEKDRQFMNSLKEQFEKRGDLSEKQLKCLVSCEERHSPEAVIARNVWTEDYQANHRETMLICVKYYAQTQYFQDLVGKVLSDEGFVPTERQFAAVTKNRYALKAIATATNPPKFPTGAIARIRDSQSVPYHAKDFRGEAVLVMANYPTGLLPSSDVMVEGKTIRIEDRYLKPMSRQPKKKG